MEFPFQPKQQDKYGFVELDEADIPFYKFRALESDQRTSSPILGRKTHPFVSLSENYQRKYSDEGKDQKPKSPPAVGNRVEQQAGHPKKSKNSIFDMDHKISKPVTQMTDEELATFKRDIGKEIPKKVVDVEVANKSIHNLENSSIIVPVSFPCLPKTNSLTSLVPKSEQTAFLSINTAASRDNIHQIHAKSTISREFTLSKSSIHLSFLPIAKNFLGEGQYSKVYKGTYTPKDSNMEYPCAVKVVHRNEEAQTLAMSESYILSQLSHPSIIGLVDTHDELGMDPELLQKEIQNVFLGHPPPTSIALHLVLEYCSNGNVWDWMRKHESSINKKLWKKWAREIASGIQFIHSMGIIHHDLKPHNILVCKN
jgi:hypothetical protein